MAATELLNAIFGGSLALAGILLVFIGFLYSQAQSFPPETANRITGKYKLVAKMGLVPFSVALSDAGISFFGISSSTTTKILTWTVGLCWAELGLLFLYGIISMAFYLP